MKRRVSGFTLVELLVVISIIGVLAAVVISRLQDARTDGLEVKSKAELNLLSKRAAIEENKALTYDVVCGSNGIATSTAITKQITQIEDFTGQTIICNSRTDNYAISLVISSTTHWCVDSQGNSLGRPTALTAGEYACQ